MKSARDKVKIRVCAYKSALGQQSFADSGRRLLRELMNKQDYYLYAPCSATGIIHSEFILCP